VPAAPQFSAARTWPSPLAAGNYDLNGLTVLQAASWAQYDAGTTGELRLTPGLYTVRVAYQASVPANTGVVIRPNLTLTHPDYRPAMDARVAGGAGGALAAATHWTGWVRTALAARWLMELGGSVTGFGTTLDVWKLLDYPSA
jgi:hypothetical protein